MLVYSIAIVLGSERRKTAGVGFLVSERGTAGNEQGTHPTECRRLPVNELRGRRGDTARGEKDAVSVILSVSPRLFLPTFSASLVKSYRKCLNLIEI